MKKKYVLIIGLLFILLLIVFSNKESDNIRIRVIANGEETSDIQIKKEVYKIVTNKCKANYTEEELLDILDELKEELAIYSSTKGIQINCEYGFTNFPPKELNGVVVPGGEYKTLLITIGEGKGSNYWTLLYPEYYGITFDDVYSGEVEIKSYIWELIKSNDNN